MTPVSASAHSSYLAAFHTRYRTAGGPIDSCVLCHDSSPPTFSWNAYGLDVFDRLPHHNWDIDATLADLENRDSDGDGYSNIDETGAGTFPGDAGSVPVGPVIPAISVDPLLLDFGDTLVHRHAQRAFMISNGGSGMLQVTNLAIPGRTDFSLPEASALPIYLPAAVTTEVAVLFSPTQSGRALANLVIGNSDPLHPQATLPLAGNGIITGFTLQIF